MKALWYFPACIAAVVAGAGASHFIPVSPSGVPVRGPIHASQAAKSATGSRTSAEGSAVPAPPVSLFDQLASDPFIDLSDTEISSLAGSIDLKSEASIARLNEVLDPRLRARLWDESLRANAASMPLKDLCDAAAKATGIRPETGFPLLFERLRHDSQFGAILGDPSRKLLLGSYCAYSEAHASSAGELLGLLPPGIPGLQDEIMMDFDFRKGSQATSLQILQLAKSHRLGPFQLQNIAGLAITRAINPEQTKTVLNALDDDAIPHRNWILAAAAQALSENSAAELFQILDHATSQTGADRILDCYLEKSRQVKASELIAWLDSQPPSERYAKIRQRLEKAAADH